MALAPHGSPRDRGESDAYYDRHWRPHRWTWPDPKGLHVEVLVEDPADMAEYTAGYRGKTDRKDWGPGFRPCRDELEDAA